MPSSQRNIKSLELICCIPDIKHYMLVKNKCAFQYHIFTVLQYPELSRHTFVTMFSCNNRYCFLLLSFCFSNSMNVSSVTLFLTRKISGFSAGDFVKHQFYNLCVLCKQIAMATMLKITFFKLITKKLDSISACCFCPLYSISQLYCYFMFSLSKYLKYSLCLKFGNTGVFCHFCLVYTQ